MSRSLRRASFRMVSKVRNRRIAVGLVERIVSFTAEMTAAGGRSDRSTTCTSTSGSSSCASARKTTGLHSSRRFVYLASPTTPTIR
jgi:hypothetical protein